MSRTGLYISIPDEALRWDIKQAALDERCTVRELMVAILKDWLATHGHHPEKTPDVHETEANTETTTRALESAGI